MLIRSWCTKAVHLRKCNCIIGLQFKYSTGANKRSCSFYGLTFYFREVLKHHRSSVTPPPGEFDNYSMLDIFILGLSEEGKEDGFQLSSAN